MLKRVFTGLLVVSSLSIAASANAHFLWASVVSGNQMRVELAESPGAGIIPLAVKKAAPGVKPGFVPYNASRFEGDADKVHLVSTLEAGKRAGGVFMIYGLHGPDLIKWSAKAITSMHDGGTTVGLPTEILLRPSPNGVIAVVMHNGKPAANAEIEFYNGGSDKEVKLVTRHDGTVALPTFTKGVVGIGAIVKVPGAGDYKGKPYEDTWDMGSLTFQVS